MRLWSSISLLLILWTFIPSQQASAYPEGWSDDIQISFDTMRIQQCTDIDVDAYNNVWVVWDDADWWDGEVSFTKLDNQGNILIPETNLSNNVTKSWHVRVAVDRSNNVQVIWRDYSEQGYGLWHAKIANDGSIIVPPHLAVSGAGGLLLDIAIAIDKYQNINIAWPEISTTDAIVYTKLDSMGTPIIERMQISPSIYHASWLGMGIDSMANCHFGYRCDSAGYSNMLSYTKIDCNGNVLIPYLRIGDGAIPSIVCDNHQNIHMTYINPNGPKMRTEYLKLDNNGNILVGPETLTNSEYESSNYVDMAIDSKQCLHAVWQGDYEPIITARVMYAKLDTSGTILIPAMQIVRVPYTLYAGEPRIAVDCGDTLHVVWEDSRVPYGHIFFKYREFESKMQDNLQFYRISSPFLIIQPNPFISEARIMYPDLCNAQDLKLTIYNAAGQVVYIDPLAGSSHDIVWYGHGNSGSEVPPGVYFVQIKCDVGVYLKKIVKIK